MNLAMVTLFLFVVIAALIGVYLAIKDRSSTKSNHAWIKGCLGLVGLLGALVWANEQEHADAIWIIGLALLLFVPYVAYLMARATTRWLLGRDKVVADGAL